MAKGWNISLNKSVGLEPNALATALETGAFHKVGLKRKKHLVSEVVNSLLQMNIFVLFWIVFQNFFPTSDKYLLFQVLKIVQNCLQLSRIILRAKKFTTLMNKLAQSKSNEL